jgi:hypothetical protein
VLEGLEFCLVRTMDEVLEGALNSLPKGRLESSPREVLGSVQDQGIQLSQ